MTLAQWGMTDPEPLPSGPLFQRLLLESPWGLIAVLVAAGVVAMISLNRAGQGRRGLLTMGCAIALAAGVAAIAASITTERERVMDLTRRLVVAVGKGDAERVGELLGQHLSVRVIGSNMDWDRQEVLDRVEQYLGPNGRWRLTDGDARVRSIQVAADSASVLRTQVKVWVMTEAGFPAESWWLLTWRRGAADQPWKVSAIDVKAIDGVPAGTRID